MFEAKELREIIDAANQPIKAMLLLAINCGFGNADCGYLQFRHVDLQAGWIDFPRNKTGVERRCPLWPETINALKEAIACRPRDESDETKQLVFLTKYRQPWSQDRMSSPLSAEFKKLTQGLKLYRKGVGYYAIRHTFATIGGETCDQVAVNGIMGHADQHISAHYRERIEANRLIAVSNYVRAWLLPKQPSNETITSIS
jgi:integrase